MWFTASSNVQTASLTRYLPGKWRHSLAPCSKASRREVNIPSALTQIRRVLVLIIHHSSISLITVFSGQWKTQICSCLIKQWQTVCSQGATSWMSVNVLRRPGRYIYKSEHYATKNTQSFQETSQYLNILSSLSTQCVCFQFKSHFTDIGECRILLWAHNHLFVC